MKVPTEIKKIWRSKYQHGDYEAISSAKNVSVMTAKRAIKEGVCSKATFDKVNSFYIEKGVAEKEMIKKTLEDLTTK